MNSSPSSVYRTCRLLKANNATLSMVNFNCACLGSDGASLLADALSHNSHVIVLFLNQNQFSGKSLAWKRLCRALARHPTLEYLYLSHNDGLGSHGIEILMQAFMEANNESKESSNNKNHSSLKVLKLAQCGISDHGSRALATWMAQPANPLQTLVLEHNEIGVRGLSHMIDALKTNEHLETLDIQYNPCCSFTKRDYRPIYNSTRNKRVKRNDSDCCCSCPWSSQLVDVIRHHHNTSLKHLYRTAIPASVTTHTPIPTFFSKPHVSNSPSVVYTCPCQVRLDMYLQLNAWGRAHFGDPHIPEASWAHLLAKAVATGTTKNEVHENLDNTIHKSLLYQLVRTRPELISRGHEEHSVTLHRGMKHKHSSMSSMEQSLKRLKL